MPSDEGKALVEDTALFHVHIFAASYSAHDVHHIEGEACKVRHVGASYMHGICIGV